MASARSSILLRAQRREGLPGAGEAQGSLAGARHRVIARARAFIAACHCGRRRGCGGGELHDAHGNDGETSARLPTPIRGSDPFLQLYTSGTTSSPKAVRVTFNHFLSNARMCAAEFGITGDDRILCLAPYTHLYGLYTVQLGLATRCDHLPARPVHAAGLRARARNASARRSCSPAPRMSRRACSRTCSRASTFRGCGSRW